MACALLPAGCQEGELSSGGNKPYPHPELEQSDGASAAADCHQQEGARGACICWVLPHLLCAVMCPELVILTSPIDPV